MKLSADQLAILCACGHERKWHSKVTLRGEAQPYSGDCVAEVAPFKFCSCARFQEHQFKNEEEIEMAKKNNGGGSGGRKKSEGRKPTLAPFVDSPFKIYMTTGGKEYDAQVLSSGMIRIDEKEFTSPSSAGQYLLGNNKKGKPLQVDGWKSWYFNKDGERVQLNMLRGSKSPLKIEDAPKKPRKAKAAGEAKKPRKARKAKAVPKGPESGPVAQEEASAA